MSHPPGELDMLTTRVPSLHIGIDAFGAILEASVAEGRGVRS